MALLQLPPELQLKIAEQTLPEGFQSLALTCKQFAAICKPLVTCYNGLRRRFGEFNFDPTDEERWHGTYSSKRWLPHKWQMEIAPGKETLYLLTAFRLMTRIAEEPRIARYIRSLNWRLESWLHVGRYIVDHDATDHWIPTQIRLIETSPALAEAGISGKEYIQAITEERQQRVHPHLAGTYSQHAATFLLSLLPNLEVLTLSWQSESTETTDRLISAIVRLARRTYRGPEPTGLSQVRTFLRTDGYHAGSPWRDLSSELPFLYLPRLQEFTCMKRFGVGQGTAELPLMPPEDGFCQNLRRVEFLGCCIDGRAMRSFLDNAPRLVELYYSHSFLDEESTCWDVDQLVDAIKHSTANRLESLSLCFEKPSSSIGRPINGRIESRSVSFAGLSRLSGLQLDLEIVLSGLIKSLESEPTGQGAFGLKHWIDAEPALQEAAFAQIVPSTVQRLTLCSDGNADHVLGLQLVFDDFADRKTLQLPALQHVAVDLPQAADPTYKAQCEKMIEQITRAGLPKYYRTSEVLNFGKSVDEDGTRVVQSRKLE